MSQNMTPAVTSTNVKFKLSFMMFLQYAIWGAWLPILYPFLLGYRGFSLSETGLCLSAGALGAIFGPFLAGQLADRLFSTEKLLAASHLIGAVLVYLLATVDGFVPFLIISAVYGFVYAPTLSLTNSISFAHIADRDRDFGPIRVWGTVGWIAAGILVGQYLLRTATPDLSDQDTMGVSAMQLAADPDASLPILLEKNPAIRESFSAGWYNWYEERVLAADTPAKLEALNAELARTRAANKPLQAIYRSAADASTSGADYVSTIKDATNSAEIASFMAVKIRKAIEDHAAKVKEDVADGAPEPTAAEMEAGRANAAQTVIQAGLQDRGRRFAFSMSAILGLVMAVFCLFLPHTPPTKVQNDPARKLAWAEALTEIRVQPLMTLFLIAVPVSMIHQFYFVYTSDFVTGIQNATGSAGANQFAAAVNQIFGVGGGGLMTIGQMSEILVLALIPFFAKAVGRKRLLLIGLAAYALRMAIFAYSPTLLPVLFGVTLHGVCFGCFIFVAFMVVDENTTPDVRATAQNLFNLVIVGIGIIVGSYFATAVVGEWAAIPDADGGGTDYRKLFSVPMWMAVASFVLFLIAYPSSTGSATPEPSTN